MRVDQKETIHSKGGSSNSLHEDCCLANATSENAEKPAIVVLLNSIV
uniref:Uncharacterized protein n=1 Tax=Anguilla anguilla TaxID=7936 RepID=A0A0E9W9V5_ANGAN